MPCFVDSMAAASGDFHLHGGKDSGLCLIARVVHHHAVPAAGNARGRAPGPPIGR
jgi:hypothetical protein